MSRPPASRRSDARRAVVLLVVGLLLALAGATANAVRFWFAVEDGELVVRAYGATIDAGNVDDADSLGIWLTGLQTRRSPTRMFVDRGVLSNLARLVGDFRLDVAGHQGPLRLEIADLRKGPRAVWLWNPFRPSLEIYRGDNSPFGRLIFWLPEKSIESQFGERSERHVVSSPILRLVVSGLVFSLGAAMVLSAVVLLLHAAPWPRRSAPAPPPEAAAGHPRRARLARLEWVLVLLGGAAWVGWVHVAVLERAPGFGDEMNYLVQARLIESGHLSMPAPADVEFFRVPWMHLLTDDGKLWNFHPIGNSLLLALGLLAGSASLIPPLVGGGILAALFTIARRLVARPIFAWLVVLVTASSHYFLTLSASYMAHGAALLFILLGTASILAFHRDGAGRHICLAGVWFGIAFLMRPISVALVAPVPAGYLLWSLVKGKVKLRVLLLAALLAAAVCSIEMLRTWEASGQFTFAYLVKGPEVGTTLAARWARGWDWRLENLYLNSRFYQDRIFGLGFVGNLVLFMVPLVLARRAWVIAGYAGLLFYTVAHSFLHFYGWGWEPRMLFETSQVTFVLTAFGLFTLVTLAPRADGGTWLGRGAALLLAGAFLVYHFGYDLPERFRGEYANYHNTASSSKLRRTLAESGIENAVVFHDDTTFGFAPSMPDNVITADAAGRAFFTGNVVHAIALGPLKNQAFLSRYPDRQVYYWANQQLREGANFYRDALPELLRELDTTGGQPIDRVAFGVPWLQYLDDEGRARFGGARLFDDAGFGATFLGTERPTPPVVVLVGEMTVYSTVLEQLFPGSESRPLGSDLPVTLVKLDPASRRPAAVAPGFERRVWDNATCEGEPAAISVVGFVQFDASAAADECVEWSGAFELGEPGPFAFTTISDDGSRIVVDGEVIVANAFPRVQAKAQRDGRVWLSAGRHTMTVGYSQHGGDAYFEALAGREGSPPRPIDLLSFGTLVEALPEADLAAIAVHSASRTPVLGTNSPLAEDEVRGPLFAVTDPGPQPGSLRLTPGAPFQLGRYPILSFSYRFPPASVYSVRVRTRQGPPGVWYEIKMRPDEPAGEGGVVVGSFDARQDDRWHRVTFDLAKALGNPDAVVEEVLFGEWSGIATPRRFYLASIRAGPRAGALEPRSGDNQVEVVDSAPASDTALRFGSRGGLAPIDLGGATASSSRADPDLERRAIDGDPATRWDTGGPQRGGEWLAIELPAVVPLQEVRLSTGASGNDFPRQLKISLSENGQQPTAVSIVDGEGSELVATIDPPVFARQIRFDQLGADARFYWSVSEVELYASSQSPPDATREPPPAAGRSAPVAEQAPAPPAASVSGSARATAAAAGAAAPGSGGAEPASPPAPAAPVARAATAPQPEPTRAAPAGPVAERPDDLPPPSAATQVLGPLSTISFRSDAAAESRATDGDHGTRWDSGAPQHGGEWLEVRFPTRSSVERLALDSTASPLDYPRGLRITAVDDSGAVTEVPFRFFPGPTTTVVFEKPIASCALRLEQTGADNRYFWSVHEVEAAGRSSDQPCPPPSDEPRQARSEQSAPTVENRADAGPPTGSTPEPAAAAGFAVSASIARPGVPPTLAVDGHPETRWDSGAPQHGDEWFQITFPHRLRVDRLELDTERAPGDVPRRLAISVTRDGETWSRAMALDTVEPIETISFDPPLDCVALRLEQLGTDPVSYWSIYELTVWTSGGRSPIFGLPWSRILRIMALLAAAVAAVAAVVWIVRRRRRRAPSAATGQPRSLRAALTLAAVFAVVLIATQADYGETWDEWEHFETGEAHYQYLFGDSGLESVYQHPFRKYYGPFSDTLGATFEHVFHQRLGWLDRERARHLHLNLLYVASALLLWTAVASEHGGRAGLLAMAVYFLLPRLLGHSHNNMKDFAVTAWMLMAAAAFHLGAQRRRYGLLATAGVLTGAAAATKINGFLLVPILLAGAIVYALERCRKRDTRRAELGFLTLGVPLWGGAAAVSTVAFWPWLWAAPWTRLIEAVRFFQNHIWNGPVLYDGTMLRAHDMPAGYPARYLLITTPIVLLPFLALGAARALPDLRRGNSLIALLLIGVVVCAGTQPLTRAPMYDGIRHFLPALGFMSGVTALGMDWLLSWPAERRQRAAAWLLVACSLAWVAGQDYRLHPYQTTYFNALVGGGSGAEGRFELDYWGNSLAAAGRYVNQQARPGGRVHVLLGLGRLARLRDDLISTTIDPDYAIVLARESLARDPYDALAPAFTVEADGAVLAKVYRFDESVTLDPEPLVPDPATAGTDGAASGVRRTVVLADGHTEDAMVEDIRLTAGDSLSAAAPRQVTWQGLLEIDQPGIYSLLLSSTRPSQLHLGGRLLIDNHPDQNLFERLRRSRLEPGLYPLVVEFWPNQPGTELELRWRRPDDATYDYPVIPPSALHHR